MGKDKTPPAFLEELWKSLGDKGADKPPVDDGLDDDEEVDLDPIPFPTDSRDKLPFEFKIIKFDKVVVVMRETLDEKYNYCEVLNPKDASGQRIVMIGLHDKTETSEKPFGRLAQHRKKREYSMLVDPRVDPNLKNAILDELKTALKKSGIDVVEVGRSIGNVDTD
jgi:hypothetical protein